MTVDEYYAAVKNLGLTPAKKPPHIYIGPDKQPYSVPEASKQTPKQRTETVERLARIIGS